MQTGRIPLLVLLGGTAFVAVAGAGFIMLSEQEPFGGQWYAMIFWLILFGMFVGVANFLHRKSFRMGGLYLAWGILALFAISVLWTREFSSKWLSSFVVMLFFGLPAGGALLMRKKPWGTVFAWTFMAIASLCGGAMLYEIWYGAENHSEYSQRVYAAAFISFAYGLCGSLNLINVGRGDWRLFRWPAVAAAAVAIVMVVYAVMQKDIFSEAQSWPTYCFYWSRLLATFAGATGLINAVLGTQRGGLTAWCKWSAVGAVGLTGAVVMFALVADYASSTGKIPREDVQWDLITRAMFASILLAMLAMICTLIARAALRLTKVPTSPPGISAVDLTCPNCKTAGAISLGNGSCRNCRLKIQIKLLDPKCPRCDYLLYHVTGNSCPECGLVVHASS